MTPVNDRDVLLQAAERYTDTGTSKVLLLAVSTPLFHLSVNGTPTPAQIAMQATAVNITGAVVEFSASSGATLTVAGDTCTLNYTDMTTDSVTITATVTDNGQTYTATQVITKVQDGVVGKDGKDGTAGSQYATATLYKWSTVNPGLPAGTATLTWSTGVNTSYSGSDGWAVSVPSNPAPGVSLWTATKQISAVAGTQTTDVTYASGAAVQSIAANGATGPAGTKNAIATAYAWASGPAPTIAGSATWTWTAADYDNVPQYWSKTKPNAPGLGYTLYEARFGLVDSSGATTSAINWTNATVTGIGYMPTNGSTGSNGASVMVAYTLVDGNSLATTPSQSTPVAGQNLPATGTWGETRTWQSTVPVAGVNQSVFQSNGVYNPVANSTTWGLPYISVWRVGSLSAISANLGAITGGSINLGNGTFTVDNNGNAVMRSLSIQDAGGNVILGVNKPLADSYVPTSAQNSQLVPSIQSAATTANWPSIASKPADSAILNSYVSVGGNLCYNADFSNGLDGWPLNSDGNSCIYTVCSGTTPNGAGLDWTLNRGVGQGTNTLQVHENGTGQGVYFELFSDPIPVNLGTKYCISAYTGAHRCVVDVFAYVYDLNGNIVSNWGAGADTNNELSAGGQFLNDYHRHAVTGTALAGQAYIRVSLRKLPTYLDARNFQDSWMMVTRVQVEEIAANATGAGPWNPPGISAIAYKSMSDATTAINNIASDSVLSKGEKSDLILRWNTCDAEKASLDVQANALGVDHSLYDNAHSDLSGYLLSIPNGWSDTSTDSPIDSNWFKTRWLAYYSEKQNLINAMAAKAATMASGVTLSTSGELLGAGGGQVQTLPVTDGARTVDYAPSDYGLVHVKEFKQCAYIGLASAGATYCTLETIKPWHDNSGGNATQWAYVSSTETWKRSGGCGDTSWGPWIRDLDRSLYTGDLNATAGATWGVNVSGAPQDVSNLVKKSNFDDGAIGGWPAQGVEVVGGGNYTSVPYTHELVTHTRDCIENNNAFNVTPGEVLYFSTWMNTEASTYDGFFGLFVYNTAGNIVDYVKATGLPAGRGWTYITGSYTVRSNGAYAYPWLQMEGFDFSSGNWLRATGMWIGRHERSATNGATFGVNIGGQITPNNVATYIAPNSVGNGQIGGDIYSSNWNGSTAQWGSGWYLERATGNFYGNAVKLRGAIMSGSYYRWEWPTDGGNGYYLGAEGLLLGNPSSGSWLQLESNGNFHSQQFTIVGGNATFSGALSGRVVNAENINVTSLDAVSARIGTLRTATYGARSEISDNGIQIFNSANLAVIQIGYF